MNRVILISSFLALRSLVHTSNFTLREIPAWPAATRHHALCTLHAARTHCAHCTHAVCTLHDARTHCAHCTHALCTLHARIVQTARMHCARCTHALCTLHARIVQTTRTHCANCTHALCTLHARIVQTARTHWHAARTHCARCALLHAALLSFSGDEWQSGPSYGSINGFQPKAYGYEQAEKGAGPSTI